MSRDLLPSRAIQGGLILIMFVVVGSLLYSWHVRRTSDAELARTKQTVQHLKNQALTRTETATAPVESSNPGFSDTPKEHSNTEMPEDAEASTSNETDIEMSEPFEPDDSVSEEESAEDVPTSPFGFGPYPEVPSDYPTRMKPSWFYRNGPKTHNHELLDRVLIKLWNQGDKNISGAFSENGKVYPLYPNTVYVTYKDVVMTDGTTLKEIASVHGALPDGFFLNRRPGDLVSRLPEGFTALDMDNEGIDPYEFLGF